jgi:hypothetical protein
MMKLTHLNLARLAGALLVAALGIGCTTTSNLTVVSTRNVDFSAPHEVVARGAKSTNGRLWLLVIPLGPEPSALKAVNTLLEKNDGDYLTNVEVESGGFSLLALSWGSVTVKADVWQTSSTSPAPAPAATPTPAPTGTPAPAETPGDESEAGTTPES